MQSLARIFFDVAMEEARRKKCSKSLPKAFILIVQERVLFVANPLQMKSHGSINTVLNV